MTFTKWFEDSAETTKLDLGNGFWVEVKNLLTIEDHLSIQSAGLVALRRQDDAPQSDQMDIRIDGVRQKIHRMVKYIVKWNATRLNPKTNRQEPVAVGEAALRALSKPAFDAIEKALDEHVKMQEAGKEDGSTDGEPSTEPANTSESVTANTYGHPQN